MYGCVRLNSQSFHSISHRSSSISLDQTPCNMTNLTRDTRRATSPNREELHDNREVGTQLRDGTKWCQPPTMVNQIPSTKTRGSGLPHAITFRNVTATADTYQVVVNTCGHAMVAENITASQGATQIIGSMSGGTLDQIMRHQRAAVLSSQSAHPENEMTELLSLSDDPSAIRKSSDA